MSENRYTAGPGRWWAILLVGVGGGFAAQGLLHGTAAALGVLGATVAAYLLAFAVRRRVE